MATTGKYFNVTADGNTDWVQCAGPVRVHLSGDFGSGTATVQYKLPDGSDTATAIANGAFTAAADKLFDFPEEAHNEIRINMASSTSPDLDVLIQPNRGDIENLI